MCAYENNPRDDEPFDQKEYEKWAAQQNLALRGIFEEIRAEREVQDAEWGGPEHDDAHSQHDWHEYIRIHNRRSIRGKKTDSYRHQLIRVAALAVAAIQSFDRRQPTAR